MARKSNKTEHVLNLLSGHDTKTEPKEEPETETEAASAEAPASPAAGSSPNDTPGASTSQAVSVIDTTEKDPLAELIQNKLSDEFEKQLSENAPANKPAESAQPAQSADQDISSAQVQSEQQAASLEQPQSDEQTTSAEQVQPDDQELSAEQMKPDQQAHFDDQTQPSEQAASTDQAQPSEQTASDGQTSSDVQTAPAGQVQSSNQTTDAEPKEDVQPQDMASEKDSEPQETSAAKTPAPEPDFVPVNVMERIVREKIDYFMDQFEVCKCDRCRADSIALTLTGLQPRYIVTAPAAVDPLMSFFTNKYTADVIVEATKACMIVKEKPRH